MHRHPFPLTLSAILDYCHPAESHALHRPAMIQGTLYAGNTRIALRSERGLWLPTDFPSPDPATAARFLALPWDSIPPDSPEWIPLDNIRGDIFAHGRIKPWTEKNTISPSPIWEVAERHLIRLSHLQMLSMLPRAEIYAGPSSPHTPVQVRFSGGGLALVPPERQLTTHSRSVLKPAYHPLTQARLDRTNTPQVFNGGHLKGWPPIDTSEL